MLLPLILPLLVSLLQHKSAAETEQFEISSAPEGNEVEVSPFKADIPDVDNSSSPETQRTPEGKMFRFHGGDYRREGYGRGHGYDHHRDGRDYHPRRDHGYGHREDHDHGKKDVHVKVPFIDRNGCTKPGDIVCNPDATDRCSYNLCILENESKNLWKKPSLTVSTITCPTDRGVTADFCNQNTVLLRAAAQLQIKKGDHSDGQKRYHQPNFIKSVDPCIVFNDDCP